MDDLASIVDWSRAQFALTAMYHWIFVPLTLGLSIIVAVMETIYYRIRKPEWKKTTKFWMSLFGVNFAIGVATGLILEFQFGTNWSNYSWFVGDIFGAPLAIEGIMAFFLEATFIAVMFFGWNKVSPRFHLTATWLTAAGATISALWILVANAWMQYPTGMRFNPETVRNEMDNFWQVAGSPVAINKFFHAVSSGWVLAGLFVVGISAWYLLKKRQVPFALNSLKTGAWIGFAGLLICIYTGDGSAYHVAERQPMKLAAMEGVYKGERRQGLTVFGILNPKKKSFADNEKTFLFDIQIPGLLSYLATRDADGFVPGIVDVIEGGYPVKNIYDETEIAPSAEQRIANGTKAIQALGAFKEAQRAGDKEAMEQNRKIIETNYSDFGYGYITSMEQLVPNVPLVFYSFHIMILLGGYFLLLFLVILFFMRKGRIERMKWLLWVCIFSIPLGYLCLQTGWIVSEVGRQPWVIQDIMPTFAAISRIGSGAVQTTFWMFAVIFTVLLIADIGIMWKLIKKDSEQKN